MAKTPRLLRRNLFALVSVTLTASGLSAATSSFDDVAVGTLAVPGTFESADMAWTLTGSGGASIDPFGAIGQSLRLNQGTSASVEVADGTTAADFLYYNVVSLSALSVNGDSLAFEGLAGTNGTIGEVAYSVTSNPRSSFDRVTLQGPILSLAFISGPTFNALILDEVTLVPEPAICHSLIALFLSYAIGQRLRIRRLTSRCSWFRG